jgi:hypothetical protein
VYHSLQFTFINSPIYYLLQFYSSLSFTLDFTTIPFILTTERTERLHRLICVTLSTKMRQYDVVSGIFLILSIIDFALAAPVLVQEKYQACVEVVHIPKDVITVFGKRGNEEIEKLLEGNFNAMGKPLESSDAHVSSSSAPPGPDHGSTNVAQAPAPSSHRTEEYLYLNTWKQPILESSDVHASSSSAPPGSDHGSTNVVQVPAPNPASSTANPHPLIRPPGPSSTALMQGSCEDCFIIMDHRMTYFLIKTTMSCMGRSTPQCRQGMAWAMN